MVTDSETLMHLAREMGGATRSIETIALQMREAAGVLAVLKRDVDSLLSAVHGREGLVAEFAHLSERLAELRARCDAVQERKLAIEDDRQQQEREELHNKRRQRRELAVALLGSGTIVGLLLEFMRWIRGR